MKLEENKSDDFLKEVFKEQGLEQPSTSFLDGVMDAVALQNKRSHQPLISKKGWIGVVVMLVVLIAMSFFSTTNTSYLKAISFSKIEIPKFQIPTFNISFADSLGISNGVSLGIVLAISLLMVQLYFLKNRYTRSIEDN